MSDTTCAIVGGGPAGMMLGLILARCGVAVTVMEKHADFLRDFRGDTVHPSTMRMLDELGLFGEFDKIGYSLVEKAEFPVDGRPVTLVDFRRLRQPHPYVAMVPQWDFLDLLADAGRDEPNFTLRMQTEVTGLLREGERITGVRYTSPDGAGELHAELTVACDGRTSLVRREAGLSTRDYPVPFDVWWFRLPRTEDGQYSLIPRTAPGRALIMIPRTGYFQVAYLIPKGSDRQLRARGLDAFHAELAELIPEADTATLTSWDDVKHLDVQLNHLRRWHREGLLCIGDAAHAMSPVGGVGINVAIQDAAAAARLLHQPLREHRVGESDLAAVQRRRRLPTAITQGLQRILHRQVMAPVMAGADIAPPGTLVRIVRRFPQLTAIPAYLVGTGVRPEHVAAPARR
ncbi:FAD-dependent oxidoreductase [Mycolicibacterium fortuitum]|uniref:FAD-dependent oxidoreductase n=2 Tax=Mycolicibacterium fortuitum TaxID=1766 RepID=A0AAE5AG76_MYCFO|nr:FAD-dependent oxidoreductase [Mycolicibacterium fortuitum]MCV7143268.1 FAD-dependent oxidoreductase [Mycolicibacterium fortuitum]MDV7193582.1 FAD-dependent oxidoreductase [Mycolicibacterium fortuitum]MDV7208277.1 FAD-dependent oxidoreductase [Mycolicibacterium fortuitum]MDV7230249.1 FAD-dependent oxidoreductase [Mycolicibacterium fortuitum]MDV7257096.1 FAD-dependent oxidoreductase [Mycolicibacterium fortuitum]